MVQEIKQRTGVAGAAGLGAEAVKFLSLRQTVLAFGRFALSDPLRASAAVVRAPLTVPRQSEEAGTDRSDRAQLL